MKHLGQSPTRDDVLRYLAKSSIYGNLGLFVGAGFCKAVLNKEEGYTALSWGELLDRAAEVMRVDYEEIPKEGLSFPELASRICQAHSITNDVDYRESSNKFKRTIANLTCWYPDAEARQEFGAYLDALSPAWIITTNYDLVIEALLTGKSFPLGPNDQLTNPRGIVPVYHLHGLRLSPNEIIITQEDYISLFRPNEYRQIKLALTVKESTTVFIGYGLGDVNVLTALDWSNNVFRDGKRDYPHDVVQILKSENPREAPYRDKNGILILEVSEIERFFADYIRTYEHEKHIQDKHQEMLSELAKQLSDSDDGLVRQFVDDADMRKGVVASLAAAPIHLVSGFITLLDKGIDETWNRAVPKNAFEAYNQNLIIILDILTAFELAHIPPALMQICAYALNRVAGYIGTNAGQSWSAAKTWESRRGQLSRETIDELRFVAFQYAYGNLLGLLSGLSTK